MSNLQYVIDTTKTAIETIKTGTPLVTKYTVKDNKVHEKLVESTKLPMVLISTVVTNFAQPRHKSVVKEYSVSLMIIIDKVAKNDDVTTINKPYQLLENAQDEIAKTLMDAFMYNSNIVKDSFELKNSSVSNTTKQHNFGSGLSCIVSFVCKVIKDYSV